MRSPSAAASRSSALLVSEGFQVNVALLPEGSDPDTFIQRTGGQAYVKRLTGSRPYLDFLLDRAAAGEPAGAEIRDEGVELLVWQAVDRRTPADTARVEPDQVVPVANVGGQAVGQVPREIDSAAARTARVDQNDSPALGGIGRAEPGDGNGDRLAARSPVIARHGQVGALQTGVDDVGTRPPPQAGPSLPGSSLTGSGGHERHEDGGGDGSQPYVGEL